MSNQCMVRVSGRVQGVGFRFSTQLHAQELGLRGYAINLPNGDVEVLLDGDQEAINEMMRWLRHGPPLARVDQLLPMALESHVTVSGFRTN